MAGRGTYGDKDFGQIEDGPRLSEKTEVAMLEARSLHPRREAERGASVRPQCVVGPATVKLGGSQGQQRHHYSQPLHPTWPQDRLYQPLHFTAGCT
jgi:hypothetical protein